ncbi:hypothetical protein V8Z80_08345 [Orrella sp. JC864]|uniref:hypothetical protein n=1 Tax=Orrella sp. JC864 TaxID=3120298 RepID=UPI0030098F5A
MLTREIVRAQRAFDGLEPPECPLDALADRCDQISEIFALAKAAAELGDKDQAWRWIARGKDLASDFGDPT